MEEVETQKGRDGKMCTAVLATKRVEYGVEEVKDENGDFIPVQIDDTIYEKVYVLVDPKEVTLEDEKQAEAVAQAELDKLKNQDPAFVQQLAAQLDAEFADSAGYSLAELGVDPVAFVQWLLADFDYQLDGTYTNSDGTGTTYADVTMRDVYAFASTFMTDATAFSRSTEAGSMDEAAMKAKLGELFNAAMEKTTDTTESYIGVDLVKQGDAWVIDEESWADETELLFGNL